MQSIWPIVTILGPALLIVAIIWATIRDKQQSTPESEAMTERATKTQREAADSRIQESRRPFGLIHSAAIFCA